MNIITFIASLLLIVFIHLPAFVSAEASIIKTDNITVSEFKLFQLKHKEVVAIAFDRTLPAILASDPLELNLEPNYNVSYGNNTMTINLSGNVDLAELNSDISTITGSSRLKHLLAAVSKPGQLMLTLKYDNQMTAPHITTVKRKRVLKPDGSVLLRSYLVISLVKRVGLPPKTIVLDAGHGGSALGATSNYLYEKELNLDITRLACDIFDKHNYDVYMTRIDDSNPSLLDRADAANILAADAFISIHNNSMPDDMPDNAKKLYRGTTALYNSAAPRPAKELAQIMAAQLASSLRIHQYPLQDRPGLIVLNATWVPSIIVEVAMMPHPQDAKMIAQRIYRLEAAKAIFYATDKYFMNSALSLDRGSL